MNDITERAERGAALLDGRRPGWLDLINLEWLDIESERNCIAGQIGGYLATTEALGLSCWASVVACGFGADGDDPAEYDALTRAWRALILRRRELARAVS